MKTHALCQTYLFATSVGHNRLMIESGLLLNSLETHTVTIKYQQHPFHHIFILKISQLKEILISVGFLKQL